MVEQRPNVLVILLDTLRYDAVFGPSDRCSATRLARRSRDAITYQQAYSHASWTLPSHASLFTGTLPSMLGAGSETNYLKPSFRSLAEMFISTGYTTGLFSCNPFLTPTFGMTRGFRDRFYLGPNFSPEDLASHRFAKSGRAEGIDTSRGLVARLRYEAGELLEQKLNPHGLHSNSKDQGGEETCQKIRWWIDVHSARGPFFAFANFMEAHLPYPQGFPPGEEGSGPREVVNWNRWHYLLGLEPSKKLEILRRLYLAGVACLDRLIDRLLVELEGDGLLDDTYVVITSDHGEAFGEHGAVGHGTLLTEEIIHVPLVVLCPDKSAQRVDDIVGLIDLHAALCRLALRPGDRWSLLPPRVFVAEDSGETLVSRMVRNRALRLLSHVPPVSRIFRRVEVLSETRRAVIADGYRLDIEDGRPTRLSTLNGGADSLTHMPVDGAVAMRLRSLLQAEVAANAEKPIEVFREGGGHRVYPERIPVAPLLEIAERVVEEALLRFRTPSILWTGGKDSTLVLWLVRRVCARTEAKMPPVIFIDHGLHFPEVFDFTKKIASEWGLTVLVARNDDFLRHVRAAGEKVPVSVLGIDNQEALRYIRFRGDSIRWDLSSLEGNHILKTLPMNRLVRTRAIDALLTGIRRDENEAREGESLFSLRENPPHMRVHPILLFSERAVWEATLQNGLPICPLYARGYRSFDGWYDSSKTADEPAWEQDLEETQERAGRGQDKEGIMRRLRELGYM